MTFFDLLGNSAFKHTTFLAIFKIKTKNFNFLRMCAYIFSFRNVCYNCKYSACIKTALLWEQNFLRSFPFLQGIGLSIKKHKNQPRNCRCYCLVHTDQGFTVTSHSPKNTTDISHYFSTRPEKSTNVMKEYYKQLISNLSWCLCRCYWPMLTALFHSYFVISFIHTQTRRQGTFSAWCQGSTFSPICMSYQVHRITDSHSRTENGLVFKHEQWMYFPNVSAEFNNAIQQFHFGKHLLLSWMS